MYPFFFSKETLQKHCICIQKVYSGIKVLKLISIYLALVKVTLTQRKRAES